MRCMKWTPAMLQMWSTKESLNVDLKWPEILKAICEMNSNTSPEIDEIHIDVFKALVQEENIQELLCHNHGIECWDFIQVDLPLEKMLNFFCINLGWVVFELLQQAWIMETVPRF